MICVSWFGWWFWVWVQLRRANFFSQLEVALFFFFLGKNYFMQKFRPAKSCLLSADTVPAVRRRKRFILVAGFLGAGKTTAIGALVKWLAAKGLKPGVVTNDQGVGLIDTALGRANAALVREVTGGCFCCRAADLGAALASMEAEAQPDVFIAEPVGSCTDLMATVVLPMGKIYGRPLEMAPMSVMVDAGRLWETVARGARTKGQQGFSADVQYIFDKQLEEASLLVLNKVDLLKQAQLVRIESWLAGRYPGKLVLRVSTAKEKGLEPWFQLLLTAENRATKVMEVDYERYGTGEARMGWYNAALGIHVTARPLRSDRVLLSLAKEIQTDLEEAGAMLAHFKMSLGRRAAGPAGGEEFSVVNAVRNGVPAALSRKGGEFTAAEMLINLRAEAEPEVLARIVARHVGKARRDWYAVWKHKAAFKPGQPQPTYRVTAA